MKTHAAVIRDTFACLETFEYSLNIIGYIPIVGSISAHVRKFYGSLEIISGIALAIFAVGLELRQSKNAKLYFTIGSTLIGHGILNSIRALFEEKIGVSLITTLPYDLIATFYAGRRFFSYQHLMV